MEQLVRVSQSVARLRRIGHFCDQIAIYVSERCIEYGFPIDPVVPFMSTILARMAEEHDEYSILDLLMMLRSDCPERVFESYMRRMK